MEEIVKDRLSSEKVERQNLLTNLLEANNMDEGALTDDELFGMSHCIL